METNREPPAASLSRGLDRAWRVIDYVALALAAVAALALLGLLVLAVWALLARAWPALSAGDTDTLARALLVIVVAGSLGFGARHGSHLHLDLLGMDDTDASQRATRLFGRVSGALAVAALAVVLALDAACAFGCAAGASVAGLDPALQHLLAIGVACHALILAGEAVALMLPRTDA